MKNSLKIVLYYAAAFIVFCIIVCFLEASLMQENDYAQSQIGNVQQTNEFSITQTLYGIVTSDVKIIVFLTIFSIPLVIYFTGKYIDKMNMEIDETYYDENLTQEEIKENKEKYKRQITRLQRDYLEEGKYNNKGGFYSGIVVDNHKFKEMFITLTNMNLSNALIIEQNENDIRFMARVIKGLSVNNESIIVFDEQSLIEDYTRDTLSVNGFDIKKLDLLEHDDATSINLLRYINSKEEIEEIANIIGKNDKYRAKLIETLMHIVKEDKRILDKNFKSVYELADLEIKNIELKSKDINNAYRAYNELILLNDKEKTVILKDVKHVLQAFTYDNVNYEDKYFNLDYLRQKPSVLYISLPSVCVGNPIYNVILSVIHYNNNKIVTNILSKENKKKTYIILPNINKFDYMIKFAEKIMCSSRNKLFYTITISNMKEFKNRYVKDSNKFFDAMDIKLFYAFRQYETIALLKKELMLDDKAISDIMSELDTSKCLTTVKHMDYSIMNIEVPSGIAYEKYRYGENKNYETMSELKSIDMKLKVNYLEEFEERISKPEEHKDSNLKPEITREEKEFIAGLLKEKELEDKNEYEDDDEEILEGDIESEVDANIIEKLEAKKEMKEDKKDKEKSNIAKEDDINERIKHINEMQEKISSMINSESNKVEHALYSQMKNLK